MNFFLNQNEIFLLNYLRVFGFRQIAILWNVTAVHWTRPLRSPQIWRNKHKELFPIKKSLPLQWSRQAFCRPTWTRRKKGSSWKRWSKSSPSLAKLHWWQKVSRRPWTPNTVLCTTSSSETTMVPRLPTKQAATSKSIWTKLLCSSSKLNFNDEFLFTMFL